MLAVQWTHISERKAALQQALLLGLQGPQVLPGWHTLTALPHFPYQTNCCVNCCLQVRLLCRRQFLARAMGLKVAQAQRQQQRQSGASSTQQQQSSPYTMTHGDMWSHR